MGWSMLPDNLPCPRASDEWVNEVSAKTSRFALKCVIQGVIVAARSAWYCNETFTLSRVGKW